MPNLNRQRLFELIEELSDEAALMADQEDISPHDVRKIYNLSDEIIGITAEHC